MALFPTTAILEFTQKSTNFVEDPRSGNWIPQEGSPLIVEASLKQIERTIEVEDRAGINRTLILMRGRLVKPKLLPLTLHDTGDVKCTITDKASGHQQVGKLLVRSIVQGRWSGVTRAFGAKIEGYFELMGGSEF